MRGPQPAAEQALRAGIIRHLATSSPRRGRAHLESLPKLIEEAGALALIGAKEKGVGLLPLRPASDLVVLADRIQIQQVLLNLIRNALEAMRSSKYLVVARAQTPKAQMI